MTWTSHRWPALTRLTAAAVTAALVTAGAAAASPADAATHAQPHTFAAWRIVKTVSRPGGPVFSAVTASGAGRAWAFQASERSSVKPAAWQLAGGSWSQVSFPGKAGESVSSAAAISARDVWAFTQDPFHSHSRALRWNGSSWAVLRSFSQGIGGAAVIGPQDVWVFGSPFSPGANLGTRHYNGHSWVKVASGHGLTNGSALSAGSVWAVGGRQVAHWNGHTWARTSVASLLPKDTELNGSRMVAIYAQSATSVWAAGSGGRQDEGGPTVLLHFNGHRWSRVVQRNSSDPAQLVPDGSGGLWIPVPGFGGQASQVLHYTGGHLVPAALPGGGRKLRFSAVAHVPHTSTSLGAGFTHQKDDITRQVHAVILQSG